MVDRMKTFVSVIKWVT